MLGEMLCSMPVLGALGSVPWQGAPALGTGCSGPARPQMCPNAELYMGRGASMGQKYYLFFFSSFWQKSLFFFEYQIHINVELGLQ